jgi:endonuclease/exonuclease/phosphatase family metal-dependent hydrolase
MRALHSKLFAVVATLCIGLMPLPLEAQHPPPGVAAIRVLTWNVQNLQKASDAPLHLQAIARTMLKDVPPDILLLQEVASREALEDLNQLLAPLGYSTVIYAEPEPSSAFSIALLSRFPVYGSSQLLYLTSPSTGVRRPAIVTQLVMPGGSLIKVVTSHLPARPEQRQARRELMSDLAAWLSLDSKLPIIVGGDFNLSWEEYSFEPAVRELLQNGSIALPSPLTNPPGSFFFRGAQTWSQPEMLFSANQFAHVKEQTLAPLWWAQVQEDLSPRRYDRQRAIGVSDHFPLRATFHITPSSKTSPAKQGVGIPLPKGVALDQFLRRSLATHAEALLKHDVRFTASVSEEFLDRLAPEGIALWNGSGLPAPKTSALSELLSSLKGRSLILSGPQIMLSDEEVRGRPRELGNGELSMLGRLVQYQENRFIRVSSEGTKREWWLFPVSGHNLRSYTSVSSFELRDLAYSQLCDVLERLRIPVSEAWLEFLNEGYTEKIRKGPEQLQEALFEVGGIYLAEQFKRIPLKLPFNDKPWMSGSNTSALLLLHDYFSAGGLGIFAQEEGSGVSLVTKKASCSAYQLDYRRQRCARIALETGLTSYVQAKHHDLFKQLSNELPCENQNVFECLNREIDSDAEVPKRFQDYFSEVLRIIRNESEQISDHIFKFSAQPQASQALQTCESESRKSSRFLNNP